MLNQDVDHCLRMLEILSLPLEESKMTHNHLKEEVGSLTELLSAFCAINFSLRCVLAIRTSHHPHKCNCL